MFTSSLVHRHTCSKPDLLYNQQTFLTSQCLVPPRTISVIYFWQLCSFLCHYLLYSCHTTSKPPKHAFEQFLVPTILYTTKSISFTGTLFFWINTNNIYPHLKMFTLLLSNFYHVRLAINISTTFAIKFFTTFAINISTTFAVKFFTTFTINFFHRYQLHPFQIA